MGCRCGGFPPLTEVGEEGVDGHHGAAEQHGPDRCRHLVRRTAVLATSITVDQDITDVANGTVARFHGSSVSGITTKTSKPGLSRGQPIAYAANRTRDRTLGLDARQARATPAPLITAPRRTFTTPPPVRSRTTRFPCSCRGPVVRRGGGLELCLHRTVDVAVHVVGTESFEDAVPVER